MTWTGTRFVAAGELSTILSSPDGTTWTPGGFVDPTPPSIFLRNVLWNGSGAVALAIGSTGAFRSADGLTWETIGNGGPVENASVVDGEFYGMDKLANTTTVYHSTDGSVWSSFTVPARVDAMAGNGSIEIAVGLPGRGASNESGSWQSVYTSIDNVEFFDAVYGSNGYVAVGGTPNGRLYHSVDGATWTTSTSPVSTGIYNAVATDGASYVAVSIPNVIVYSPDGVAWQDATATSPALPPSFSPYDLTWGAPGFVAVGSDGLILYSPDGIVWQPATSGTTATLHLVKWTGLRYVALSDVDPFVGTVVTSLDGVFWQVEPQPVPGMTATTSLNTLVSRPGLTLLMGSQHKTWTSADGGRSWVVGAGGGSFTSMGFVEAIQIEGEILAAVRGASSRASTASPGRARRASPRSRTRSSWPAPTSSASTSSSSSASGR